MRRPVGPDTWRGLKWSQPSVLLNFCSSSRGHIFHYPFICFAVYWFTSAYAACTSAFMIGMGCGDTGSTLELRPSSGCQWMVGARSMRLESQEDSGVNSERVGLAKQQRGSDTGQPTFHTTRAIQMNLLDASGPPPSIIVYILCNVLHAHQPSSSETWKGRFY